MLGSIRKFSTTIYAKIILIIIVLPFIFWGMGSTFSSGGKNVVVVIEDEKYTVQDLGTFISRNANKEVKANEVDQYLSAFIAEKLIEKEVENFGINLSDKSLSMVIKQQKEFQRENKFSRTEYEKFLLKNNITAVTFEKLLSKQEKKKQLLDLVSGGVVPSKFLINLSYNRINQKRNIELINLNKIFAKQFIYTEEQIKDYFENNKNKFSEIFKSIKLLELKPKKLVGNTDFNDLFFKKIDEIDDLIGSGKNLDYIIRIFNLEKPSAIKINKLGKNVNEIINKNISQSLIKNIFDTESDESTVLVDDDNKYLIYEIIKTENIYKDLKNDFVRKKIILDLENITKRKLIAEIIDKINKNNFSKSNFNNLSKDENVVIKKINLKNANDNELLKNEIVKQIYRYAEKQVIVVNDLGLSENYLIYIDEIIDVVIDENSNDYKKYLNLSRLRIVSGLFNTYDNYIQKRYKIDINHQGLSAVKNFYN